MKFFNYIFSNNKSEKVMINKDTQTNKSFLKEYYEKNN